MIGRPQRHSTLDDLQGLVTGTLFVAIGLALFRQAGLLTGGTVGIAFVLHYAAGWPLGLLIFAINLPFYALAWHRMGRRFTLKTFGSVTLLALLSQEMPRWIELGRVDAVFAAVAGGLLIGAGFVILFRHRASLGGLNVLVLWLHERYGWRAGTVQMVIDGAILLAAMPWLDARRALLSIAAALAMNAALAINHRPGRYMAL